MKFCCETFKIVHNSGMADWQSSCHGKGYYLMLHDHSARCAETYAIGFCPWCGKTLPQEMIDPECDDMLTTGDVFGPRRIVARIVDDKGGGS